jgi:hypothetical protein
LALLPSPVGGGRPGVVNGIVGRIITHFSVPRAHCTRLCVSWDHVSGLRFRVLLSQIGSCLVAHDTGCKCEMLLKRNKCRCVCSCGFKVQNSEPQKPETSVFYTRLALQDTLTHKRRQLARRRCQPSCDGAHTRTHALRLARLAPPQQIRQRRHLKPRVPALPRLGCLGGRALRRLARRRPPLKRR